MVSKVHLELLDGIFNERFVKKLKTLKYKNVKNRFFLHLRRWSPGSRTGEPSWNETSKSSRQTWRRPKRWVQSRLLTPPSYWAVWTNCFWRVRGTAAMAAVVARSRRRTVCHLCRLALPRGVSRQPAPPPLTPPYRRRPSLPVRTVFPPSRHQGAPPGPAISRGELIATSCRRRRRRRMGRIQRTGEHITMATSMIGRLTASFRKW